jgi:hypothetical protein
MTCQGLPSIAFISLVLAAGVYQGMASERWHSSSDVGNAVRRLENVPNTVGDWKGESIPLETADLTHLGIKGQISSRYRNAVTGDSVTMLIVCGRPGPISVHTPDVCYRAAGYTAVGETYAKEIPIEEGKKRSVWAQVFRRPATQADSQIEVNWAWLAENEWVAANNSRLSFAGSAAIYKLYVVRELSALESNRKRDASALFMHEFLPALEKVLSPAPSH